MATWRDVDWSKTLGGNDREGDCAYVACANLTDILLYPQIVMQGECERFYALETGWTPLDKTTDKGVILEKLIQDWIANGWPADPLWQPKSYEVFQPKDIATALREYAACPAVLALPDSEDFSDDALSETGVMGHAVCVVQASETEVRFVTWGRVVVVSMAWWLRFAREVYGIAF